MIFIQSMLHALANISLSFVCIKEVDEINSELLSSDSSDPELEEIVAGYNKLHLTLGGCLQARIRRCTSRSAISWKQLTNTRAVLVKTWLFVVSRSHLFFAKSVSAVTLVGFYRHAPADAICVTERWVKPCVDTVIVNNLDFNPRGSNHLNVVAAFFCFN